MRTSVMAKAAVMVALAAGLCACETPGAQGAKSATIVSGPLANPSPELTPPVNPLSPASIIHPKKKYYGLAVPGVPHSLDALNAAATLAKKKPNLLEYYEDWTHPFDPVGAQGACDAGITPMLTWESWSWENIGAHGPKYSQPKYAPRKIAAGKYDSYIKTFAESVKSLHCTIMLRFDQEPNGFWYPWGLSAKKMHNTTAQYRAMWHHVWNVFHKVGAKNVVWMWSPNYLYKGSVNSLKGLYPGNKYVDMVGIDGYLLNPTDTPNKIFGPVTKTLKKVAPKKPWIVAETGVAAGPKQPKQITSLLNSVAKNKKLDGLVYLDQQAPRANWSFSASKKSIKAFSKGIANTVYGSAR
jgi:hypothetical protein